jgi:hypothetical protein
MIPTMIFSIELLDFFAKAGIKRRQYEECDHHRDKNQIIHITQLSGARCAFDVGNMPRRWGVALINFPVESIKNVLKCSRLCDSRLRCEALADAS